MTGIEIAIAAAAIGSAAVSAMSAIQQGQAQAKAQRYNAAVQERNAAYEIARSKVESERRRREVQRILARNRAKAGAAGVTVEGSIEDFLVDQYAEGEVDALMIEHGGSVAAQGRREQAAVFRAGADNAESGSYMTAAGILIGGAAKAGAPFAKSALARRTNPKLGGGSRNPARVEDPGGSFL